ncbi:MAG: HAMP domain-containing histidine kinase [Clostridia bacterium]|nr:HAMP domain-containing histidine kinase [Clostridia bacterium]
MSTPKKRSRSIARQLNAELVWRSFGKKLFWSVFAVLLLLTAWCWTQENVTGARAIGITSREFTGSLHTTPPSQWDRVIEDLPGDVVTVARHIASGSELAFSETFPFRGIAYRMNLAASGDDGAKTVSAEVILAVLFWGFLLFNLIGLLYAVLRTISGSGVIRRYLRPIDDMTAWAAQLSEERHSVDAGDVRDEVKSDPTSAGLALDDVLDDAIGEIDEVEDSGARIELHQTELEGLEDALNNMLKRLEEAKKKQIRFVDDASHELRTPIAVIHGYADMLDRWGKSDPKVLDEAVSAIKTESEHMTALIDQLLFLARGEMDRHVLDKVNLDAQELLDEIMVESEMLDEGRHVFRMLSHPAEPEEGEDPSLRALTIRADAALIKQAVRILRDNAVKYTPDGGEISFKAYAREDAAGRRICLEVSDTGIGIPSDELPRIFDRFYRGTNARADNAGGSGLGLSIAQWIVKEHGGKIEAISGSGFGTKMTIVMPGMPPEAIDELACGQRNP